MGDTFFPPDDIVHTNITMQRWIKHWVTSKSSINVSGTCAEMFCQIIRERDPEYYDKYKHLLEKTPVRKKEVVKKTVENLNIH